MNDPILNFVDSSDANQSVTGSAFDARVLQAKGPIAVEFMSYGCSHCHTLEPILQRVAEMVKSKEEIVRVNVAIEQKLADTYGIQVTPTLIMFLKGRQVGRIEGPNPTVASVLTAVTQPFKP
jgi:thioredoxin 1